MRILHVIASLDPQTGGPGEWIRYSADAFRARGSSVEVVCGDDPKSTYVTDKRIVIHALGKRIGPWAYNARWSSWLSERLSNYDVVISHGLWLYCNYAVGKLILRQRGRSSNPSATRFFIFPHGMLDPYLQGAASRRWKAWRNWFFWKLIEQRAVHLADGLMFTCQRELERARQSYRPYYPRSEWNVGYGIIEPPAAASEFQEAFHAACPLLGQRPYLLYLGRIDPKKGVELLLRSYAQLAKHISSNVQLPALVLAGPVDSLYARRMQRLAGQLGMLDQTVPSPGRFPPRVYFPGMLQGAAKWGAFYGCDAFVLPSYQENFGIAVAEALACGRPVLISDQVNVCREILDLQAGFVAEASLSGTTRNLKTWMGTGQEVRTSMQNAAQNCFRRHFQCQASTNRILSVLESYCER